MSLRIEAHDHGPGEESEAKWCPSCDQPAVIEWDEFSLDGLHTATVRACMRCGWGEETIHNG